MLHLIRCGRMGFVVASSEVELGGAVLDDDELGG